MEANEEGIKNIAGARGLNSTLEWHWQAQQSSMPNLVPIPPKMHEKDIAYWQTKSGLSVYKQGSKWLWCHSASQADKRSSLLYKYFTEKIPEEPHLSRWSHEKLINAITVAATVSPLPHAELRSSTTGLLRRSEELWTKVASEYTFLISACTLSLSPLVT